ncbi:MAG: hypothetical protein AB1489_14410 [Acidobacteriota bacterium]
METYLNLNMGWRNCLRGLDGNQYVRRMIEVKTYQQEKFSLMADIYQTSIMLYSNTPFINGTLLTIFLSDNSESKIECSAIAEVVHWDQCQWCGMARMQLHIIERNGEWPLP